MGSDTAFLGSEHSVEQNDGPEAEASHAAQGVDGTGRGAEGAPAGVAVAGRPEADGGTSSSDISGAVPPDALPGPDGSGDLGEWAVPGAPRPSCNPMPVAEPAGPGALVAAHPLLAEWAAQLAELASGAVDLDLASQTTLMHALAGFGDLLAAQTAVVAEVWRVQGGWGLDGSLTPSAALASATGHSREQCSQVFRRARRVHSGTMPATLAAWQAGELPTEAVDLLVTANSTKRESVFVEHEADLVEGIRPLRHADTAKTVAYWRNHADALLGCDGRPVRKRQLRVNKTFDGAVSISGILDPIGGGALKAELDRLVAQYKRDDRKAATSVTASARSGVGEGEGPGGSGLAVTGESDTVDGSAAGPGPAVARSDAERYADALVELVGRAIAAPREGKSAKIALHVAVGDDALGDLCELRDGTVIRPADLVDYLDEATIRFTRFDPATHQPTGATRAQDFDRFYRGAKRFALWLRDRHCQHPAGCDEPDSRCDGDHEKDWGTTKQTTVSGGRPLCVPHNRISQLRNPPMPKPPRPKPPQAPRTGRGEPPEPEPP